MKTSESKIKGELCRYLRENLPECVIIRHEDMFTAGIPDFSISYKRRTFWFEVKYANPKLKSKEIQNLLARQLQKVSFCCRYIIFKKGKDDKLETRIVTPQEVKDQIWEHSGICQEGFFDYQMVIDFMQEVIESE